jgi:WD40 repeat protein
VAGGAAPGGAALVQTTRLPIDTSLFTDPPSFSPDGKTLLAPALQMIPRRWDITTGKPIGRALHRPARAGFSPDGKVIATASDLGLGLWDAATGQPLGRSLWRTRWDSAHGGAPRVSPFWALFSPDSRSVLAKCRLPSPIGDEARLFAVPQPIEGDPVRVRRWLETITLRELDAGGEVAYLNAAALRERHELLGDAPAP